MRVYRVYGILDSGLGFWGLLGGSGVVVTRAVGMVTILVTLVPALVALLITTHEHPSKGFGLGVL